MNSCNQPVGIRDLENYLNKFDYLSGYSEAEKAQIRENIGAIGMNEIDPPTRYKEVTYSQLANLVENKRLVVGNKYALIDFQSIYSSNVKVNNVWQSWGDDVNPSPICTLILSAVANDKFDPRVIMIHPDYANSPKWIVEYDFESTELFDGVKTKGTITYLKDTNNNSAHYNFKDELTRRTKVELRDLGVAIKSTYVDLHTFNVQNGYDFTEASENQNIHDNVIGTNSYDNVFFGSCFDNIFHGTFQHNTFASDCQNNVLNRGFINNQFKHDIELTYGAMANKKVIDFTSFKLHVSKRIICYFEDYYLEYLDDTTLTNQFIKIP